MPKVGGIETNEDQLFGEGSSERPPRSTADNRQDEGHGGEDEDGVGDLEYPGSLQE